MPPTTVISLNKASSSSSLVVSAIIGLVAGIVLMFAGAAVAHTNVNCGGGDCIGDEHDNVVDGTTGYDAIYPRAGHDRVEAKAWGDHVHGEGGDDLLYAGDGDDAVRGDDGWDFYIISGLYAGLQGRDGNDNMYGGNGTDVLSGGNGADYLNGGSDGNHDHCKGGGGGDVIDYCHVHGSGDPAIMD